MRERQPKSKSSYVSYLVGIVIGLTILVILALQNSTHVELKFITWTFTESLALFLTLVFGLGFLIGIIISLINNVKKNMTISRQKKEIQQLELRVNELESNATGGHSSMESSPNPTTTK